MVDRSEMEYVAPDEVGNADRLVSEKNYSVVPGSSDGQNFDTVFCTEHPLNGVRMITTMRHTSVADYIPDSTPLADAFYLFNDREWYPSLRGNQASGLITYWAFNSREFRIQLYAGLSRVEELSRDLLAKDGCGVSTEKGLNLSAAVLKKVGERFASARQKMGGNRFVDELDFHNVNDALRRYSPWRIFLHERVKKNLSNREYDKFYDFTNFRDAVMHGRVLFPTYFHFKECSSMIGRIGEFIEHLDAYKAST